MKRAHLRFSAGFRVALASPRVQAATMTLAAGETEGDPKNRHRGADQWLFVVHGTGAARVDGKRHALRPGTLVVIEHGDTHEIVASRRGRLVTLNLYVPPAYSAAGDALPRGRR